MLHYWPTNQCRLERVSSISFRRENKTQMYVCTLEDIYSSRCSNIAVHVVSEILNGILTGLYTLAIIGRERMRKALRSQLTQRNEIELQLHEKLSHE